MNFELTTDQQGLREAASRFAHEQLPELARELEETARAAPSDWVKRYAELGFLGINIDARYGGLGLGPLEALLVIEEFAKISGAVAFPVFESCTGPVKAIEKYGSEALKQRVIPRVCSGDMIIAISMSEADAGTALTDLKTRGRIDGDTVILNGAKRWCSGGGHADGYLIYCRLSDAPAAKGIGAVYVDKDTPGLTFGTQERLMGFRGVPSSDIYLDNVTVPVNQLVVPAGGFAKLMEAFDLERCGNATMSLAQAVAALEDVTAYVQERHQFGRALVEFQAVQLRLAEMKMKVEAARLLIYRAAANAGAGHPSILDSSLAKCFANETSRDVTGSALQLMGGYGYSKENLMERRFRDAWGWGIAGGAIDIQKVNIAAAMIGRRFDQRRA
ncbi:acyl-CoA dehydrogenase family protein [Sphingosinicella microcystinivorans]|uniref:acyl-CoA dehydrogenase family protein n=1 Tax=Sphingosinicella microcystinivorans TaxID=335406 RepID=UPI0022F4021C|nr:acyl-CoA dehydrogenase family protein [Sphingosinicella microcystinivorans]WBX83760.1 acyl-CoA dehydrogenase family protein [Sphingosinicella microcystinivorans]